MHNTHAPVATAAPAEGGVIQQISQLARQASIEINVQDEKHLEAASALLPPGTRVYVSHLPRQDWAATVRVCGTVRRAGFEPVAHVPVRLLESAEAFKRLLEQLRKGADAREILLISGDYAQAAGPYHATSQALATGMLEDCGFSRVSVAGHPEGHPRVSLGEIRYAEWEKAQLALRHELEVTLVTQFLFEPAPFLSWANEHRSRGLATRYVCGLSGPARISTLLRYAMRCGVGPSVKALGAHHTSITNLLAEHGPDRMLRKLAEARLIDSGAVGGVHLFCFGGFIRTAQWLSRVAAGDFRLQSAGGFDA